MKRLGLLLAITLVVLVSPFVSAAEPLDDARIELIRQHCGNAQTSIQRVVRSDTVTRVNRGRAYEETIKLLAAFNGRAALNTYNIPEMIQVTADYEKEFSNFKATYLLYDTAIKETLRINCVQQPVTFYDSLDEARQLRKELTSSIQAMDALLGEYDKGLTDVTAQIKATSSAQQEEL